MRALDAVGFRIHVGEEGRVRRPRVARPEAAAELLLVAADARDHVRVRRRRHRTAGEARRREVERAPPELHRRRLAAEARTVLAEHRLHGEQRAPEARDGGAVVGRVHRVLGERDRVRDLGRQRRDLDRHAGPLECRRQLRVEARHRLLQGHALEAT